MPTDQQAEHGLHPSRIRVRKAPLCYSRAATAVDSQQARIDAQSNAALVMLGAVTCAAAFLVVYGGWGT